MPIGIYGVGLYGIDLYGLLTSGGSGPAAIGGTAGDPDIPHLAWPLKLRGTRLAAVEQDTLQDVAQCVHVLASTPVGARLQLPEFGTPDPTFSEGAVDPQDLADAAAEWEPRAALSFDLALDEAELAQGRDRLAVQVTVAEEDI